MLGRALPVWQSDYSDSCCRQRLGLKRYLVQSTSTLVTVEKMGMGCRREEYGSECREMRRMNGVRWLKLLDKESSDWYPTDSTNTRKQTAILCAVGKDLSSAQNLRSTGNAQENRQNNTGRCRHPIMTRARRTAPPCVVHVG